MSDLLYTTIKGRPTALRTIHLGELTLVCRGRILKIAQVFDEYWLERDRLPHPESVIEQLRALADKPDLFMFAQRVPDTEVAHSFYHEFDNYAVLPLTTYEQWFQHQVPSATRRNIRASEKRGVSIRVCEYDDEYVRGIRSIYDEAPIRAGRRFWHYGKDLEAVRRENGTYASRSTYLAAYFEGEMVGYLKVVWDTRTGAIMQILSKLSVREFRPNNALLAETVRQACMRNAQYLIYEKFDYGQKTDDSLTRFKQSNGFARMDIPLYYIPLTARGTIALRLGLHRSLKERIPEALAGRLRNLRTSWQMRGQASD
jgi:hypothetical protein